MKKITLCGVLAMLCLCTIAQPNTIKPLHTGERIPDLFFTKVLNYPDNRARLSDFQQKHRKMILFDFWITSCIPCIKSFKKLDSLQKRFDDQLQIVLVTPEDSNKVRATIRQWEKANNKKLELPVITGDTVLKRYIHKQSNPHYAWIAPDNVLLAQTTSSFIIAEIVEAYLKQMDYEVRRRGYLKGIDSTPR